MQVITGEARRRWTCEERLAAVTATFAPGARVSDVARRIGTNVSMVFCWRK